jgi:hypothetical protein
VNSLYRNAGLAVPEGNQMRFLYFYLVRAAPVGCGWWRRYTLPTGELGLRDYLGGPFAGRSGGLITFQASSIPEAERLVAHDPFVREDLFERPWVKE